MCSESIPSAPSFLVLFSGFVGVRIRSASAAGRGPRRQRSIEDRCIWLTSACRALSSQSVKRHFAKVVAGMRETWPQQLPGWRSWKGKSRKAPVCKEEEKKHWKELQADDQQEHITCARLGYRNSACHFVLSDG